MININNKSWEKLRAPDIEKLLSGADDETFFFEFKADDETPAKLIKEISAFSNTYGGYILLGINDDKTIGGCKKWSEQRIHTTIHDSITPVPIFDVRKFIIQGKRVYVIKIEEGTMPPYITNKGAIFERLSSGSYPIKDSSKLSQLYYKREDQLRKVKNKIELPELSSTNDLPQNICGYLDLGFSVVCSEKTNLQKNFFNIDLKPLSDYLKATRNPFSISRLGFSYLICFGNLSASDHAGNKVNLREGINNFIEIMFDGSVRCRIILSTKPDETEADIDRIVFMLCIFSDIYTMLLGKNFSKIFIYAHKYERLSVLKQFTPYYRLGTEDTPEDKERYAKRLLDHKDKYGDILIVESSRLPKNDYSVIDKRRFDSFKLKYNTENLINELFSSVFEDMGYIDLPYWIEEHK